MSNITRNRYYTEVTVGIYIESDQDLESINTQLDEGTGAKLSLTQRDGQQIDTNVLEVWEIAEWQDWDSL